MSHVAYSTPVSDLAFDMKHGLLLLADPQNRQVDVFKIATLVRLATITLPHAPVGLDVTPGGDSALVLLDSTATLAVINLASGYSVTTVHLPFSIDPDYPTDTVNIGWRIRIAADNRALITMRSPDAGVITLVELNLVTDSLHIILPAASSGGNLVPTVRSPDGSLVVLPGFQWPQSAGGTMYTAATHTYTYTHLPVSYGSSLLYSISNSPYYFLTVNSVVDTASNTLGYVGMTNWFPGVITPNGRDVFMPTTSCVIPVSSIERACVDSAAGLVIHYLVPHVAAPPIAQALDIGDAPQETLLLAVSPDGNTLVGVGPTMLMAFDLTQSSPPSAYRTRSPIVAAMKGPMRISPPVPRTVPVAAGAASKTPHLTIHIDRFRR